MPQKNNTAILLLAAVAVGAVGYILGTGSRGVTSPVVKDPSLELAAGPSTAGSPPVREETEFTSIKKGAELVANGIGSPSTGSQSDEDIRKAFLDASEKRGDGEGGTRPKVGSGDEGAGGIEEDTAISDGEIADLGKRLEALEQAFAVDGRRNRGRGAAGTVEADQGELASLKETVSNLYDIVGGLPSMDTLETKIAAVDGAIEEMNSTMAKLLEIGKKLEDADAEGGKPREEIRQLRAEIKAEMDKTVESGKAVVAEVDGLKSAIDKNLERISKAEEGISSIGEEVARLTEAGKVDGARLGELATRISAVEAADKGGQAKLDGMSERLGVMDRNLRSVVEGYRKVYENAAKTEKRFVAIEAFLGNAEERLGAIEANFRPGQ